MRFDRISAPNWLRHNGADLEQIPNSEWIALHAPGKEYRAAKASHHLGLAYYLPLSIRGKRGEEKSGGSKDTLEAKLTWPGYVFCRIQSDKVGKLLGLNRTKYPVLKAVDQASLMRSLHAEYDRTKSPHVKKAHSEKETFKVGRILEIPNGPLKGYWAEIKKIEENDAISVEIQGKSLSSNVRLPQRFL
ncbi:MAG: hypothetical protein AAF401_01010, partial [Pseudomonadota bacterium]